MNKKYQDFCKDEFGVSIIAEDRSFKYANNVICSLKVLSQ